jgi:hypothetical protein
MTAEITVPRSQFRTQIEMDTWIALLYSNHQDFPSVYFFLNDLDESARRQMTSIQV